MKKLIILSIAALFICVATVIVINNNNNTVVASPADKCEVVNKIDTLGKQWSIDSKWKEGVDYRVDTAKDCFFINGEILFEHYSSIDEDRKLFIPYKDSSWFVFNVVGRKLFTASAFALIEPPFYQVAWEWYSGVFFDRAACPFKFIAGIVILAALGIAFIYLIVIAIKKFWYFLDYGSAIEIHGTGTIVNGEFETDENEEDDEEDADNIEDAEQNQSEENTEDNEGGRNYNFSFDIKINTSVGEEVFGWYVSEEVFDKFEVNEVVSITYKIGQISKRIEIVSIPQLDQN